MAIYSSTSTNLPTPTAAAPPNSNFAFDAVVASFNILLSLAATVGNAVIIAALRRDTSMHGPSKVLLCSLALSDLCVGALVHPLVTIVVISGLTDSVQSGELAWTLLRPLGNYLYAVSLLTITCISLDRFLAVRLNVHYRSVVNLKRVSFAVLAVWLTPALVLAAVRPSTVDELAYHILNAVYISVGIVFPSLFYIMIYKALRRHQNVIQAVQPQLAEGFTFNTMKYKKSVNNMLVVYFALLLCYTPSLFLTVAALANIASKALLTASQFTFVLVLLNSTLNPALYCWRLRELRRVSVDLVKNLCPICR